MSSLKLKGHFWIENNRGQVIGPGKKKLLEEIDRTGSIKAAAKAMNMSYRHAWEMTNTMNKNNSKPLLEKAIGGTKGGGTRLTKEGIKLIKTYEKVFKQFEIFKSRINKSL